MRHRSIILSVLMCVRPPLPPPLHFRLPLASCDLTRVNDLSLIEGHRESVTANALARLANGTTAPLSVRREAVNTRVSRESE